MKRYTLERLGPLLHSVQKPASYIGGEVNAVVKEKADVRMAVSYPDLYEIGMSNNGIRILYEAVNSLPYAACERVFSPAADFEGALRGAGLKLFTLETLTPLSELDLLGINAAHELLYSNILQLIDLGGIPLLTKDRGDGDPIVLIGGQAVSNPLPLFDFADAFFIGDGEDGLKEVAAAIAGGKKNAASRTELIKMIGKLEGILIPDDYISGHEGASPVKKRVYRSNELSDPERPIVPNIRISQDRAVVEVTRGCWNLCKFCHSGYYDLPYRAYDEDRVLSRVLKVLQNTGYSDLTLSSLSLSDYRPLTGLLPRLLPILNEKGVSISLPSLKVDMGTLPLIELVSDVRKTSLTFAVESASETMRSISNKKVLEEDLLDIIRHVSGKGWKRIKFYFMLGLPGCNKTDEAEDVIVLLKKVQYAGRKRLEINVTLSPFVPKPHTPFQWEAQMDADYFNDAVLRIKRGLPRSIKIKNHDVNSTILEGVLARGDEKLGAVIYKSYLDGCRMDSWHEHFRYSLWEKNLNELLPEWKSYTAARNPEKPLPWSIVDTGFGRLVGAWRERCADLQKLKDRAGLPQEAPAAAESLETDPLAGKYEAVTTLRLRLSKTGRAKFIPHIDQIEIIKRSLRRSGIPAAFTRGFNRHERVDLSFPVPIGVESLAEICDVQLYAIPDDGFKDRFAETLPEGIGLVAAEFIPGRESVMGITAAFGYTVECLTDDAALALRAGIDSRPALIKETKKESKEVLFDDAVLDFSFPSEMKLEMTTRAATGNAVRADSLVLQLAGFEQSRVSEFRIVKTAQYREKADGALEII